MHPTRRTIAAGAAFLASPALAAERPKVEWLLSGARGDTVAFEVTREGASFPVVLKLQVVL